MQVWTRGTTRAAAETDDFARFDYLTNLDILLGKVCVDGACDTAARMIQYNVTAIAAAFVTDPCNASRK